MPLYVKDNDVAAMATELQHLLKAPSKAEALRQALRNEIERQKSKVPLRERIARLQRRVAALGPTDPDFDRKKYTDDMWGDISSS